MKRFLWPLALILGVFLVNLAAMFAGVYEQASWFDVPMHFLGGYVVAILGIALFGWLSERIEIRPKKHAQSHVAIMLLEAVFIVGFVMMVSVGWEIKELFIDQFSTAFVQRFGATQASVADTIGDFVNAGIGAATAWIAWRKS